MTQNNNALNSYQHARQQMVDRQLKGRGIRDERVLAAMAKVPRHMFVEEALVHRAYGDHPLPIGENQTISQPFIVAQMTEALELKGSERVLEIGTGSGYQAAILAELSYRVYTVERVRSLMIKARKLLEDMGYRNVLFHVNDGTCGWAEQAPYDAIIVTAGGPDIPPPLVEQLAPGGRLIVPIGPTRMSQYLIKVVKDRYGKLVRTNLGACRFVDLIGQHGWSLENGNGS